jgi:hypothetical protein
MAKQVIKLYFVLLADSIICGSFDKESLQLGVESTCYFNCRVNDAAVCGRRRKADKDALRFRLIHLNLSPSYHPHTSMFPRQKMHEKIIHYHYYITISFSIRE